MWVINICKYITVENSEKILLYHLKMALKNIETQDILGHNCQQLKECLLSSHKQHFCLKENLHLHNKSYMKSRAPFLCQQSYSGYYLLSGILPHKKRKFFIQFANYICHVQAAQSIGEHSEVCELNFLLEDGKLCSQSWSVVGFNNTWGGRREDGPVLFSALCWQPGCCHEPDSPIPWLCWKGKLENKVWRILHFTEWTSFAINKIIKKE